MRYVFRDGDFRDPATGTPMPIPKRKGVCAPMIIQDVPAHMAAGGVYVSGRAAQRELRNTHGLIPFEVVGEARSMPARDFDKRDDHWQSWLAETKDKVAKGAGLDSASLATEMAARKAKGSLRDKVKRGEKRVIAPDTPGMTAAREYVARRAPRG